MLITPLQLLERVDVDASRLAQIFISFNANVGKMLVLTNIEHTITLSCKGFCLDKISKMCYNKT